MSTFILYGEPGWGSGLTEVQLAWYGLEVELRPTGHLFNDPAARAALAKINPLAQIPTLVLPDGTVMTESAAMTLWLADHAGSTDLVPGPADPERAAFLRWLIFIVANIYPTYTYADDPRRFVAVEGAQAPFKAAVNAYAQRLYGIMEDAAVGPWFLGERLSAIDVYLGMLTLWRPGARWFARHTPKLTAAAEAIRAHPRVAEAFARNHVDEEDIL